MPNPPPQMTAFNNLLADGSPPISVDMTSMAPTLQGACAPPAQIWAATPTVPCCTPISKFSAAVVSVLPTLPAPTNTSAFTTALQVLLGADAVSPSAVAAWTSYSASSALASVWTLFAAATPPNKATLAAALAPLAAANNLSSQLLMYALCSESLAQLAANIPAGTTLQGAAGNGRGSDATWNINLSVRLTYKGRYQDVAFNFSGVFYDH